MTTGKMNRRVLCYIALAAFMLLNIALFLHPMNPADFLAQILVDPLATIADPDGGAMAALFWCGVAGLAISFFALIGSTQFMHRLFAEHKPVLKVALH